MQLSCRAVSARRPDGSAAPVPGSLSTAVIMEATSGDWAPFRLTDDFAASAALASGAFVSYTVGMSAIRLGGDFLQARIVLADGPVVGLGEL